MSTTTITLDTYDTAIVNVLRKHPEGIRSTLLNKEAKIDGKSLNVKTFNLHLKNLVKNGIAEKKAEGQSRVSYKLKPTKTEVELHKLRSRMRKMLTEAVAGLYLNRDKISEVEVEKTINDVFFWEMHIVKYLSLVTTASSHDTAVFSLGVNEITEEIREFLASFRKIMNQNDATHDFFKPFLEKIITENREKEEEI